MISNDHDHHPFIEAPKTMLTGLRASSGWCYLQASDQSTGHPSGASLPVRSTDNMKIVPAAVLLFFFVGLAHSAAVATDARYKILQHLQHAICLCWSAYYGFDIHLRLGVFIAWNGVVDRDLRLPIEHINRQIWAAVPLFSKWKHFVMIASWKNRSQAFEIFLNNSLDRSEVLSHFTPG